VATFFIFSLLGLPRLKIKSISPAPNSDNSGRNSIVLPLRGLGYLAPYRLFSCFFARKQFLMHFTPQGAQKKVPFIGVES
jgi:hypothetical protein